MSLNGMTGYGRAEGVADGLRYGWDARSVNAKGLDVRLRMPHGWESLELAARKAAQARLSRGSVTLNLHLRPDDSAGAEVRINHDLLRAYLEAMEPYGLDGVADRPRLDALLALPGVLDSGAEGADEETRKAQETAILAGLDAALRALGESRAEEGGALTTILTEILGRIAALVEAAEGVAASQPKAVRDRLMETLGELLKDQELDEARFAQEAAVLAGKADVREELDRLHAHVEAARGLIAGGSPCGRKLDFLAQEFNREANTLCSKSADLELTRIGLDLKAAIEQMREQIQNVE